MPIPLMPAFGNPYEQATSAGQLEPVTRVMCPLFTIDCNFIKSIRPRQGTITGVVGTLWKKLTNELKERQIVDFSKCHDFEQFVAGCRIISAQQYEEYQQLLINSTKPRKRKKDENDKERSVSRANS